MCARVDTTISRDSPGMSDILHEGVKNYNFSNRKNFRKDISERECCLQNFKDVRKRIEKNYLSDKVFEGDYIGLAII
jgi:hypothetical protein